MNLNSEKEKSLYIKFSDNKNKEAGMHGCLPLRDAQDTYSLTEHSDREKKTWCGYMERVFRESRDITDKENA